jgi:hypothetical protein
MSESFFSEQPRTSRAPALGRSISDSAVSIDSGRASEVIFALRAVFAVGELTNAERDALRILVVRYMSAMRRRDVPPERALVFVKELAQQAQSAQDRCDALVGGIAGSVSAIQLFDCHEYYRELTRQIVGWAIEAYYSADGVD